MKQLLYSIGALDDYLVFALVSLVIFIGVRFVVRRIHPSARFLWQFWTLLLAGLLVGWLAAQYAGEKAQDKTIASVNALASTYAAELEHMGHSRITEATLPDDPTYLELIQAQIRWQKLNPFAHDIYTIRKRPDGKKIIILDSQTDYINNRISDGPRKQSTPIGKAYMESDEALQKAFSGQIVFDIERIKNERGIWVNSFVPMRDATGKVEAVLGVGFDAHDWLAAIVHARRTVIFVTALFLALVLGGGVRIALLRAEIAQRAVAEKMLRESEQRLLLTIRQMPLGFIEWDVDANVRAWNPSAERIFGYSAAEMLGKPAFPLIVAPAATEKVKEVWSNLLHNTGGAHSVNENVTKDGRSITCEWFNTPLIGTDNKVVAAFSVVQDITRRVQLEEQLQQSERLSAIGQLSAGVAHDFNNILTIILGHAGLLLTRPGVSDLAKVDVRRIKESALRAASLTRQLLTFSRRQAMFPRPLDLGKIVQEVAAMLSRLISAEVKFHVIVSGNVPPVEADPLMIEQVVANLVLNARDALEGGGEITVSVDAVEIPPATILPFPGARAGHFVRLAVRDNGMGIPAENINRIFEPFFTTKPPGKGTGLGLSVVHGIIQQHSGWIAVESTPGKGATFSVYIPASNKVLANGDNGQANQPTATAVTLKTSRTILVAEDEQLVRELAINILERAGYSVIATSDGVQALQEWSRHRDRIDLLFTDMVMPNGIGGRELSHRILADRPDLPVIYASGYSIDTTAPGFCESERMQFLQKPYMSDQLLVAIHKCLERTPV